ncbi:MAG: hypothetical protein U1B30_13710 [Pseudomonadota bacterium]|nr:hypothetical protein [Pseudomonadota bacterium]
MRDNTVPKSIITLLLAALFPTSPARGEFALNFLPNPNVVNSMANQSCNAGTGGGMMGGGAMGGMMGGMMGFGPGCGSGYFLQQVVSDTTGAQFYHVIIGTPADGFALEYYMRTGGCCWFGDGGGGGGMMGGGGGMMGAGNAPFSSSYGDTANRGFNAFTPLSNNSAAGNGSGNPSRVYMRQINNDANITQEFVKATETNKPRISQNVNGGTAMSSTFNLDMSNGNYTAFSNPVSYTNTTNVTGVGSFNAATAPTATINAGRFRYTPGASFSGSFGTYNYAGGNFNVYGVNWLSYCASSQNPDHQCVFNTGGGMMGGMMGGGGGGGGMMGGM